MLNTAELKKDFPIFIEKYNGKDIIYLDNAATSQKPNQVIEAIVSYYKTSNANVGRSSHFLADNATEAFEGARKKVAAFINAHTEEVVFTKNSTESLNMVAYTWGVQNLVEGDVILTLISEHNSSFLPWKVVAKQTGAKLKFLEINEKGEVTTNLKEAINSEVKVVVLSHGSNVLGNIIDIKEISKLAHAVGAVVAVDGSQVISSMPVNVKSLDCDFYAFSGHKMLGPTGIGILWGRKEILETLSPMYFGGGNILKPDIDNASLKEIPYRFEAGTQNIAGAVGLGAAIDYLTKIGMENVHQHMQELSNYAYEKLSEIEGITLYGPQKNVARLGLVSFSIDGIHSHDVAAVLSGEGIAVRAGTHCAMKLFEELELPASVRASFQIYNSKDDADSLIVGIKKAIQILGKN